ncbi:MAG: PAC2 family protein [Thermodesulfobacteriota bacterium]
MFEKAFILDRLPHLRDPLFIAGFEGWGNALNLSKGMVDYLIEKLQARPFGRINPDPFYRFDENRPVVDIQEGLLKELTPPGGAFYATEPSPGGRDLVLLKAVEPSLRWSYFAERILALCQELGIKTIICLGSMYDNVLHTDTVISALASSPGILERLKERKVISVNYKGPSAVHSTLLMEAQKSGLDCVSLWCHCPYYLQGTMHFGLMSHLASLLGSWGGFELDTRELDVTWKEIARQIQGIIDKNPELQAMISDLRKAKIKGTWEPGKTHDKVIHLEDFIRPK